MRGRSLRFKDRPIRDIAVPFNQRRYRAATRDDDLVEFPDGVPDRPVVAIDQQTLAFVVALLGVTRKMNFTYLVEWKVCQLVERGIAMVGRRHEDVVDIKKQTATGAARYFTDKLGLAHRRSLEGYISRWVLKQDPATNYLLHFFDVLADPSERRLIVGKRQKIVEVNVLVGRPSKMLGHKRWFVPLNQG